MATIFENVYVSPYNENEEFSTDNNPLRQLEVVIKQSSAQLNIRDGNVYFYTTYFLINRLKWLPTVTIQ